MTIISNPEKAALADMVPRLQSRYPRAELKKAIFGQPFISVPMGNYRMFVRDQPRRARLLIDFQPPIVWNLIGMFGFAFLFSLLMSLLFQQVVFGFGVLIILVGFLITKSLFKNRKKAEMEIFRQDVERAMHPEEGSIF